MRRTLTLLVLPAMFAAISFAESWSGSLLDASCYDKQAQSPEKGATAAQACQATSQTTSFALDANGKVYKLDSGGNSKASAAIRSHAERSAPGAGGAPAKMMATVEGTESGGTIKADKVEIQ